jgi:hypothetical protein
MFQDFLALSVVPGIGVIRLRDSGQSYARECDPRQMPVSLDRVVVFTLVSTLVAVTEAFGTALPEVSTTTPVMVAKVVWE